MGCVESQNLYLKDGGIGLEGPEHIPGPGGRKGA